MFQGMNIKAIVKLLLIPKLITMTMDASNLYNMEIICKNTTYLPKEKENLRAALQLLIDAIGVEWIFDLEGVIVGKTYLNFIDNISHTDFVSYVWRQTQDRDLVAERAAKKIQEYINSGYGEPVSKKRCVIIRGI